MDGRQRRRHRSPAVSAGSVPEPGPTSERRSASSASGGAPSTNPAELPRFMHPGLTDFPSRDDAVTRRWGPRTYNEPAVRLSVRTGSPRRRMLLLLTAVLVPYLVLAALSLRMIGQERQSEARRSVEERQRRLTLGRAATALFAREPQAPATRSTAPAQPGDHPGPPVDKSIASSARSGKAVCACPGTAIRGAPVPRTRERGSLRQPARAGRSRGASDPLREGGGDLQPHDRGGTTSGTAGLCAPVAGTGSGEAGRRPESRRQYEWVLELPPEHVDGYGVPLAFYAAPHLLGDDLRRQGILRAIRMAAEREGWLSPAALYQARDLARLLKVPELASPGSRSRSATVSRPNRFSRTSARLVSVRPGREPIWIAVGQPVWMVSVAAGGIPGGATLGCWR